VALYCLDDSDCKTGKCTPLDEVSGLGVCK
jgi:hypothetical protein